MNHTVLKWLEYSSRQFPEKIAFTDEAGTLTFARFDSISRSVGTYLTGAVAPGNPVVVMSGRHTVTPAVFLGAVRAGCFYAPIDGTMPVSRLNQILGVIKADILLVDREMEAVARTLSYTGRIVVIQDILDTPADEAALQRAAATLLPTSPLYVIFTSGSTGVPKGVITSHGSLMTYIDAVCQALSMDETDVLANQSPFDYIAAIRDIYIPLKTGASTFVVPKSAFSMPTKLFELLNRNRVTTLCWSAAGIELPAKLGGFREGKPEYLKKVCFSGSVMPCKYLRMWQDACPDVRYVNQYGPTEATASCTYYVVPGPVEEDDVLPIGVPYENYGILLLDDNGREAAPGQMGEICVRGPVLALGYYGDPQRTADSFIQNPLNPNYRELIYRTGDLGCFRADGNLEFHGRLDRQIKHMGHRIELGEIEATATKVEGVKDCCALYRKETELLYLFFTGTATPREIAVYFRKVLPAFMVPRKLIALEELPRLPNGKLDMQTLKTMMN